LFRQHPAEQVQLEKTMGILESHEANTPPYLRLHQLQTYQNNSRPSQQHSPATELAQLLHDQALKVEMQRLRSSHRSAKQRARVLPAI
jgi:hypothetical protein